jgi:hypothetical protein
VFMELRTDGMTRRDFIHQGRTKTNHGCTTVHTLYDRKVIRGATEGLELLVSLGLDRHRGLEKSKGGHFVFMVAGVEKLQKTLSERISLERAQI